jgi:hypothetical protein
MPAPMTWVRVETRILSRLATPVAVPLAVSSFILLFVVFCEKDRIAETVFFLVRSGVIGITN